MNNVILITSAICTINKPLDYTESRSYFSHEQRYEQSLQTIISVRNKISNSYIIFIEGTKIPEYMEENISKNVDYYFNVSNIEWVYNCVNGLYKGQAEIASILAYFKSPHYDTYNHTFNSISKISGRYRLCTNFNFDYIEDSIILHIVNNNPHHYSNIWMSTMFYTIPKKLYIDFIKILEECFNHEETNKGVAIEHILPLCIVKNNIKTVHKQKLLVEGEYGPWGGYVCH